MKITHPCDMWLLEGHIIHCKWLVSDTPWAHIHMHTWGVVGFKHSMKAGIYIYIYQSHTSFLLLVASHLLLLASSYY